MSAPDTKPSAASIVVKVRNPAYTKDLKKVSLPAVNDGGNLPGTTETRNGFALGEKAADDKNDFKQHDINHIHTNGLTIKDEEEGTVDLMTIKEEILEKEAHSTLKVENMIEIPYLASQHTTQLNSPTSGPPSAISSGAAPNIDVLNVPMKTTGLHLVASKMEGSSEVNLHSVPVFSPRPIQPNAAILKDSFAPARPARKRRETDDQPRSRNLTIEIGKANASNSLISPSSSRPNTGLRTFSTPNHIRSPDLNGSLEAKSASLKARPAPNADSSKLQTPRTANGTLISPLPSAIPLPPLSLSTYLQLELSSHRPSQSLIYRTPEADFPYESSRVKIERLLNFLFLPHHLEAVMWFGTLACLDYWLYTFTILPLRLLRSLYILFISLCYNLFSEVCYVGRFVYNGSKRMWHRRNTDYPPKTRTPLSRANSESKFFEEKNNRSKSRPSRVHRRVRGTPSPLQPDDKADILKGLLIIFTCLILLRLDASRMYHWVRGQAVIKLYVIYNVLEVFDRLLSAIGQDVLECLFSRETLERKPNGHSKILRPFWLFVLALIYTVFHATALFYQVVTLNVAVNSYSNALITLLMSNQFVEIKGTVFKKFEKENLFQITCADIVERFQLWHMLIIIASRNIVETGGWNIGLGSLSTSSFSSFGTNTTDPSPPWSVTTILPQSFTILPSLATWLSSKIPTVSQVMGPFVIVLGSEMIIDWLKHAYINKFNNVRPIIYSRFLDVLAKDYYTNAFGDQNLTKRLGLPIIPLTCLLIRAGVQTYHMFVAAWMPDSSSSATASLASIHKQYTASRSAMPTSSGMILARRVDDLLYHIPSKVANSNLPNYFPTILVFLLTYLVLLACKLILGMLLLAYSRARYRSMKEREKGVSHHVEGGRRYGGWGTIEVDEEKRRFIYEDDPAALRNLRERESKEATKREQAKDKPGSSMESLEKVKRYDMVAKRIW